MSCGGSMSRTVTVKVQLLLLPAPSAAVQRTVVWPSGKIAPGAGVQARLVTVQLSLAWADGQFTCAVHWLVSVFSVRLAPKATLCPSATLTRSVKVQLLLLPEPSAP